MLLIDRAHVKNLATLNQLALNSPRSRSNFEDKFLGLLEPEQQLTHAPSAAVQTTSIFERVAPLLELELVGRAKS